MKERGMIFNSEMVRAILAGRKTQTRRPIKWKQTRFTEIGEREDGSKWPWSEDAEHACDFWHPCPFGAVGDRIWVRETFCPVDDTQYGGEKWVDYRATPRYEASHPAGWDSAPNDAEALKWRPSIHMPRWASRILLEITDVRVERLNAISEEDARAEGIIDGGCLNCGEPEPCGCANPEPDATDAFAYLWQSIYGQENWNANPWVWVISFKRVEGGAA
ncbi:ASCH domain-containing protein [Klebsiella variicola]